VVTLAFVVHLFCVLKLFEYSSVHCNVGPNVGTAFTFGDRNQMSPVTRTHKPCKTLGQE
jgi:hypothetical protein